ncbi:elongation factor P 5-aminopentanone reductase [Macrococcus animalis]
MGKYLVIGASGDIGKQITHDLLNKGHEVIAHYYQSDVTSLIETFKDETISFVRFDLSQPIESTFLDEWMTNHLDGMIYAAGTSYFAPIQEVTHESMDAQYQIHFANLVRLTQYVLSGLLQKKHGRIIVISSIWGETGSATESIYSGMKAAQIGYIKSIAKELAMTNITANVVTPGIVSGKMTLQLHNDEIQDIISQLPQQRLISTEEISHAVMYLLDDLSQSITGTVHSVNGGWYI